MEVPDWTNVLLNRLQMFEPENAIKIMGYLLLNYTQQDIIECALGPDNLIHALINKAKSYLSSSQKLMPLSPLQPHLDHLIPIQHMPMSPTISRQCSSPSSFRVLAPSPSLEPLVVSEQQHILPKLDVANPLVSELIAEDLRLRNQAEIIGLEDHMNPMSPLSPGFPSNYIYQDAALAGVMGSRIGLTSSLNLPEHSRACHYFHKGYCRNGANCRYFHGQAIPDIFSQMLSMEANELLNEDHIFSPGSVEKLELEIRELLKARNGLPVSIAALPLLYQEKYGRPLQADGYLTESQRHGKTGFSLTKLLARLKNGIRVVDRPHGQHSVVLSEDVAKYMEVRNERSDSLQASSSSSQIYLTFPAESTFTEEDVLKYFNQFGPVRDVRIPRQEKRMFGFVSFVHPETVRVILSKGHPHYICGSRVLVKPYKEKPRLNDRKYAERIEHPIYPHYQHFEMDHDYNAMPALYDNSRSFRRLTEEQERAIDLESRRLLELHISPTRRQNFVFSQRKEASRHSEVVRDNFNCLPLSPSNEPRSEDEPATPMINNDNEQDSDYIILPDSPFASPH